MQIKTFMIYAIERRKIIFAGLDNSGKTSIIISLQKNFPILIQNLNWAYLVQIFLLLIV